MSTDTAAAGPEHEGDVRPLVRTAHSGNRSLWIAGIVLLFAAIFLFQLLDSRRQAMNAPATTFSAGNGGVLTAPPPLSLPPGWNKRQAELAPPAPTLEPAAAPASPPREIVRIVERPVPAQPAEPIDLAPQPSVVVAPLPRFEPAGGELGAEEDNSRVTARRLVNPSVTVPQGVVIAAVLETALDSTRPGGVRAIVSRDVRGFDGTKLLIPRGSRLYGEYTSDLSAGQKRALIRWQRLTRPDGVIIDLDSPAADPLGRAGVRGKVNSHFFSRFGGAILQSVLDIGVGVATREATGGVYVALPGATQNVTATNPNQVTPTLTVKQGASVSVFVARDLDFSTVQP
jgi:type IV secretion system protein VirB10